jgi:hypothetical protein
MNLHGKSQLLLAPPLLAMTLASRASGDGVLQPYGETHTTCFSWAGFYYGVNAGAAWNDSPSIRFTGTGHRVSRIDVSSVSARSHLYD